MSRRVPALLAVIAALSVGWTATGAGQARPAAAPAAGAPPYEVYALRYATMRGYSVAGLVAGADRSRKMDIPFIFWVLKGPGGRNVLVDAGCYHGPVFQQWKLTDFVKPSEAIGKVGLAPRDITDIVITHIHWDHVNGADLFPAARVWIQRDEFAHYVDDRGGPKGRDIEAGDAAMLARLKAEGQLILVDGDAREIIPGVTVYTGGKHTFASQYVAVKSKVGTVVVASDNIYLYENLEKHLSLGETLDPAADLRVQDRILTLASSPRLILPGHDPAVFERFPRPGNGVAFIQ